MKLKKELRAVKEINEQARRDREMEEAKQEKNKMANQQSAAQQHHHHQQQIHDQHKMIGLEKTNGADLLKASVGKVQS